MFGKSFSELAPGYTLFLHLWSPKFITFSFSWTPLIKASHGFTILLSSDSLKCYLLKALKYLFSDLILNTHEISLFLSWLIQLTIPQWLSVSASQEYFCSNTTGCHPLWNLICILGPDHYLLHIIDFWWADFFTFSFLVLRPLKAKNIPKTFLETCIVLQAVSSAEKVPWNICCTLTKITPVFQEILSSCVLKRFQNFLLSTFNFNHKKC